MTAVEWYAEQFSEHLEETYGVKITSLTLLNKALIIHKQEIIEARNDGFMASGEGWNGEYGIQDFNLLTEEIKSEQYYNEIFKSE